MGLSHSFLLRKVNKCQQRLYIRSSYLSISGRHSLNIPVYNTFLAACAFYDLPNVIQDSINSVQLSENFMHVLTCLSLS